MTETFKRVRDIFYSGSHAFRGELEIINDIAFMIDNGYLIMNSIELASHNTFAKYLDDAIVSKSDESYAAQGGSPTHVAPKLLAANYLREHRNGKPLFEQPFCSHYPDVINDDRKLVIECGDTQNPEKILLYFKQGGIDECLQVPYPPENGAVLAYSFAAGPDLIEFLDYLAKERRGNTLSLLEARDRKRGVL